MILGSRKLGISLKSLDWKGNEVMGICVALRGHPRVQGQSRDLF